MALIFGVVNAVIKPVIKVVGCVFYMLTLGLFALVVNALLFLLTDRIAGGLDLPFQVDGFWAAFWGAIVMAVVTWLISVLVPDSWVTDAPAEHPGRLCPAHLGYGILPSGGQRGPAHSSDDSGQHGRER